MRVRRPGKAHVFVCGMQPGRDAGGTRVRVRVILHRLSHDHGIRGKIAGDTTHARFARMDREGFHSEWTGRRGIPIGPSAPCDLQA